jgi:transcriptional regulator with XRE-family HTH domain
METPHEARRCRCGTLLARHNQGTLCAICQKQVRDRLVGPPNVPHDFWQDQMMRAALDTCHIGKIIAAYRLHPWHGQPISQTVVAGWLDITQSRLSKIENGSSVKDLDKLATIAQTLRIPTEHLWFALPGQRNPTSVVSANDSLWFGRQAAPEILGALDRVRLRVDRTIASGSVSINRLALIEERVADHVVGYTRTSPLSALNALAPDILEVEALASERQPASVQARLSEAISVLSLLNADALMKLGEINRARYWYGTARLAADDTPNLPLRASVRAQEAMLPYYYGQVEHTVRLAREAQALLPNIRSNATALAAAAEARALARLGDSIAAEHALNRAQSFVEALDGSTGDEAFQFNEKRLLLYMSGTLTYIGQLTRAQRVQNEALKRYAQNPHIVIDPALIRLDQAIGQAAGGHADDACALAIRVISQLPAEHRTKIVVARARDVVTTVPSSHRDRTAVSDLRELVVTEGNRI